MPQIHEALEKIQQQLKAPKTRRNIFGEYSYRSCEDILDAVKPLLDGCTLTLHDDVVQIGDRYYVKAVARLFASDGSMMETQALAREPPERKAKMDESQTTGSTSSYARKYALNGLFAIDDTKDADTDEPAENPVGETKPKAAPSKPKMYDTYKAVLQGAYDTGGSTSFKETWQTYQPDGVNECKKYIQQTPAELSWSKACWAREPNSAT